MKYVQADITTVTDGYIMQQTNCTGTATKGLSKTLRDKFPNTCPYDFRIITGRQSTPGTSSFLTDTDSPVTIINIFGQVYPGSPKTFSEEPDTASDREMYFKEALEGVVDYFWGTELPVKIAIPYKIGCGLAKGNWDNYKKMLEYFEHRLIEEGMVPELTIYCPDF